MPHCAALQPGREHLCTTCERYVSIRLRNTKQAECSICGELVFDVEVEAERNDMGADAGEGGPPCDMCVLEGRGQ